MGKNKAILIFVAAFFLNLYFNNLSFATGSTETKTRYPDYAYEFAGRDKFETFNRKMFIFNSKLNKFIIRPVNTVWASIMPKYGMDRIQCLCTNLEYPKRCVSCLLQKDFKGSGKETLRFLTNSTIGLGGLYDPAKSHFKLEPRQEDMEQMLANYKVKNGPYIVLPIITPSNVRGVVGKVLDCPLDPALYAIGPVTMIAKAGMMVNKTSYMQSLIKAIDSTYADPYDITKKLYGIDNYIKNSNLDRKDVLAELANSQDSAEIKDESITGGASDIKGSPNLISNAISPNSTKTANATELKADIKLADYNPQSPVLDSMRTAFFEVPDLNNSIWSEMSVWNKCFSEKIKTSSVNIDPSRPNYKYRYILQKNKTAPLAIIYPSIGEGVMSHHPVVMAKIFYDQGYSVAIQGSSFQWEFVKSMPKGYKPGIPARDADYSRMVTYKIMNSLESKKGCKFEKKILVGTSFGALTTLFIAAKEEVNNTLNISNYISINPPIELFFALKQLDKNTDEWNKNPNDIKMRAAIAAGKIMQVTKNIADKKNKIEDETLPFSEDEAKLITGFILRQKLSDLVFTLENGSKSKKNNIYASINNMSYYDYAQKYLLINQYKSYDKLNYDTSLYSLANFLQTNKKYKIYHSIDDYFVNPEQLAWLKKQCNDKSVFFSNGSHLGFLYRKEFIDTFKNDIMLKNM